ncbi:interferon regulatory factor [Elysia marginata]|uniref:Interferon regulatory factor n=1 Tax=Elysia marginata TaxID=1093978 RepID=A0AAV4H949_9GAST|nr:interferon regulatory factor [Elysia marginata]
MPTRQPRTANKERRVALQPRRLNLDFKNRCESRPTAKISSIAVASSRKTRQQQQPPHKMGEELEQKRGLGQQSASAQQLKSPRMSEWLWQLLDNNEVSGLKWVDRENRVFSIDWVHKSNHNFNQATHSDIFYRYAVFRDTPEEIITNSKLVCGGEVKVREGKSFALPIPIDLHMFCSPLTTFAEEVQAPAGECVMQEENSPSSFAPAPCSTHYTHQPNQFNEYVQSDLALGQTLEISGGAVVNQNQITQKYQVFTPVEDPNSFHEAVEIQGSNHDVSMAYLDAVATILNDQSVEGSDLTGAESSQLILQETSAPEIAPEIQQAPSVSVEVQVIEQADSLSFPELQEEDLPDLFKLGHI